MIEKISVVRRGRLFVAMGGAEHSGGGSDEVFSVVGWNESDLKRAAMEEASKRGIERVIGLNAFNVGEA